MFIIVKRAADLLVASTHPVVHATIGLAQIEAERLSTLNPGIEFIIFQAKEGVKQELVYKQTIHSYLPS